MEVSIRRYGNFRAGARADGRDRQREHAMAPAKKAKVVAAKELPAEGQGSTKRTPQSAFDPAKGAEVYEPEKIVGTRQKNVGGGKCITQYCVKWKGYDSKQNTYEPIEHLAGCEDT